ncbi:unnamed protein product [Chondrus crispus]|uniref:Uncharacterized protein n=1 Tax=Chondrus crispus TaxID=2769 RepID=R7QPY0_CHOCR|nr:unnamed protein product [Chondrus crispus]CDF39838.1 unnamed protein product [Chondrus crispus]|eukprot:XP_005710132.1 unnamed protein product [Chondrus crispus]
MSLSPIDTVGVEEGLPYLKPRVALSSVSPADASTQNIVAHQHRRGPLPSAHNDARTTPHPGTR